MKKIILFVVSVVMVFLLTGCGTKKELTAKDFENDIKKLGFTVSDYTEIFEDKNIETLMVAKKSEYEIEFHVYRTEKAAKSAFEGNRKAFSNYKKSNSIEKKVNTSNYQKYTLQLSDQYDVVIRNGKSLLYASINLQHKKDIDTIIKKIGY